MKLLRGWPAFDIGKPEIRRELQVKLTRDYLMAETSEKLAAIAGRILAGGSYTDAEVKRLAGSVVRQKEKKAAKKALRQAGVV